MKVVTMSLSLPLIIPTLFTTSVSTVYIYKKVVTMSLSIPLIISTLFTTSVSTVYTMPELTQQMHAVHLSLHAA